MIFTFYFFMMIFWIIALIFLPLAGTGYVMWHVWQLLPFVNFYKWIVTGVILISLAFTFIGFSGLLDKLPLNAASVVYDVGDTALVILLYVVMIFFAFDILRLLHLIPNSVLCGNIYTLTGIVAVLTGLLVYGNIHYNNKFRAELDIVTDKSVSGNDNCETKKIVLLSDLHLGYHNRVSEFVRWVKIINGEKPDIVLIGGDIIDVSTKPLFEENVAEAFREINAPVYACLGNHEYYSGERKAEIFYKDANITVLRDSVAMVDGISVIGRDDRSNPHRNSLSELMKKVTPGTFTILLDHQPYHLEEAENAGVDFQFSGHTHDGQMWPISLVTKSMYEKSYGYLKKAKTEYYVSSGMGIWGGKYRIGTRSEYVVLTIKKSRD